MSLFIITRRTDSKNSRRLYVGKARNKANFAKFGEVGSFGGPKSVQSYSSRASAERRLEKLRELDNRAYWDDARRAHGQFKVEVAPYYLYPNLV